MVSLSPMPRDAWETWRSAAIRAYAADMVHAGSWPQDDAIDRATTLFASLVPNGPDTPGHEFRSIVTDAGEVVGSIWFAAEGEIGRGGAFIWDIVIDPAQRGRGHGRAAMDALEVLARSLGYDTIRLHAFGDNAVARHLYRTAGYHETDVTMAKRIG
jgi:ribosomal protein S18 acetylase RimI-like enzyme